MFHTSFNGSIDLVLGSNVINFLRLTTFRELEFGASRLFPEKLLEQDLQDGAKKDLVVVVAEDETQTLASQLMSCIRRVCSLSPMF